LETASGGINPPSQTCVLLLVFGVHQQHSLLLLLLLLPMLLLLPLQTLKPDLS
jgi:hypothetical protein